MTDLHIGRTLWAITPDALTNLIAAQRDGLPSLDQLSARAANFDLDEDQDLEPKAPSTTGPVAVIPLSGVISPRPSMLSMLFGGGDGGSLSVFRAKLRAALADDDTTAIVLDIDSPGGLTDLVQETADEIRQARGTKPIIAVANTVAASAAYWIAAQADKVVITPSGLVGSIGTVAIHDDWSTRNAQEGLVKTYITAGKHKADGNRDQPLSPDARADMQQRADDFNQLFVAAVAAGRGVSDQVVHTRFGEGRLFVAQRALEAGLVDEIAPLESVLSTLKSTSIQPAASRPDNEEHPMDDTVLKHLARQHGLDPATATEDDVNAAVIAAAETTEAEPSPEPEPAPDPSPEPPASPEPTEVTLTAAQYDELKTGAAAGVAAQEELARRDIAAQESTRVSERDTFLQAAVNDGRLHRSDLSLYQLAYDQNPDATRARVDALSPGVVPALERAVTDPANPAETNGGLLAATLARHGHKEN